MLSLTKIRAVLKECQFDPRKPGPYKIIADINNEEYFRGKAIELMHNKDYIGAIRLMLLAHLMNH